MLVVVSHCHAVCPGVSSVSFLQGESSSVSELSNLHFLPGPAVLYF